jgi:hypothetical protein
MRLLEGLQTPGELLLLAGREAVPDARSGAVQELSDYGPDASLHLADEDLLCKLLEASLQSCELDRWTPTTATLAALVGVAPPLLGALGVVGVAVVRSRGSYPPAALPVPRYAGAFDQ